MTVSGKRGKHSGPARGNGAVVRKGNRATMRSAPALLLCAFAFLFADLMPADARVRIKERTTYYSVSGKNGAAIFRSMRRRGPRANRSHAIATTLTKTTVRNIRPTVRGRRCVLKSFTVDVDITYRLPRWRGHRGASPRVRKAWRTFQARVKKHEDTHGRISRQYARQLERALRRVSDRVSRNCRTFASKARRTFDRIQRQANRNHARFDRRESRMLSRTSRIQKALYTAR